MHFPILKFASPLSRGSPLLSGLLLSSQLMIKGRFITVSQSKTRISHTRSSLRKGSNIERGDTYGRGHGIKREFPFEARYFFKLPHHVYMCLLDYSYLIFYRFKETPYE